MIVAQLGQGLDLLLGIGGEVHAVGVVDLLGNGLDLLLDGAVQLVGEGEIIGLLAQTDDFLGQLYAAFAALAPNLGQSNVDAQLLHLVSMSFSSASVSVGKRLMATTQGSL